MSLEEDRPKTLCGRESGFRTELCEDYEFVRFTDVLGHGILIRDYIYMFYSFIRLSENVFLTSFALMM